MPKFRPPQDCREVEFIGDPKFALDLLGQSKLLDVALTTEGAGGVILLIQLAGYVRFGLAFVKRNGTPTSEYHFVMMSMPVAFKLEGPRMAASIAGNKDIKLINIASLLTKALVAMQGVKKVSKMLLELRGRKGVCAGISASSRPTFVNSRGA